MLKWFREFRWTRPFWAALFTGFGGLFIGIVPFVSPVHDLIHVGYGTFVDELVALGLLAMAGAMLFFPVLHMPAGLIAVGISVISLVVTNLGGFIIGMMAGIIGGSLSFGWVPDKRRYKRGEDPPPDDGPRPPHDEPDPAVATIDNYTAVKDSVFVGGRA